MLWVYVQRIEFVEQLRKEVSGAFDNTCIGSGVTTSTEGGRTSRAPSRRMRACVKDNTSSIIAFKVIVSPFELIEDL
jgi:hypothetical protein